MKDPRPCDGVGLCHCGCGGRTMPASKTNTQLGWIKGRPMRYIYGHQGRGRYSPLRGTFPPGVLVDPEDLHFASKHTWSIKKEQTDKRGSVHSSHVVSYKRAAEGKHSMIYLHRLIMNPSDGKVVDHINGDTLDNRRRNLRVVSIQENNQNLPRLSRRNKTGFRGVSWDTRCKRWEAYGMLDNKKHHIGRYRELHQAAHAAYAWRLENHAGFVMENDPFYVKYTSGGERT